MKIRFLTTSFLLLFSCSFLHAQSTFSEVYDIFQTKCVSCHGGGSPQGNLDLSGTPTSVYQSLVNVAPTNPAAAAKGHQLIDPGHPERSFLLRKAGFLAWDAWAPYQLDPAEGNPMPPSPQPTLDPEEVELIRQWVLFGAPETDTVVDPTLLADFYGGKGLPKVAIPAPPATGEGFQLRLGSIFLEPFEEIEYFSKIKLDLPSNTEVIKIEVFFNAESHHFILYDFDPGSAGNFDEGLRDVESGEGSMFEADIVAAWQNPQPIELPPTTAYYWAANEVLDLNYHLLNYHPDSILAGDVYINVYTQPAGLADQEMISRLVPLDWLSSATGGPIGPSLVIPNDGQPHTFTEALTSPFQGEWYIWLLSSHTHARGIDYDIFLRNSDGSRGAQVYEGFYNTDYTFNQGYYDWEHPPVRYFEPLMQTNMFNGMIHEATFVNNTQDTLSWGNTTADEMMLTFVQYTLSPLTGLETISTAEENWLQIAPNPFGDQTRIAFHLPQAGTGKLFVTDLMGRPVKNLQAGTFQAGNQIHYLQGSDLAPGIYLVVLEIDGKRMTQKVMRWE